MLDPFVPADPDDDYEVTTGLSAGLITLIGALLAWQILRLRFPGRAILDVVSFMSIGIPAVITGFAVMILHLTVPIGIYGTIWILILAYSYRLAVSSRMSRAALIQIHPELEEASFASGGRWLDTIGRVMLPLLAPSLMASFVLLFIVGFREFTIPMILQSEDNWVLSVMELTLSGARRRSENRSGIEFGSYPGTLTIARTRPVAGSSGRSYLKTLPFKRARARAASSAVAVGGASSAMTCPCAVTQIRSPWRTRFK